MARRGENPLLVFLVLLVLSCLLSVVMPRSLRLGSQQQDPMALKLTSSQEVEIATATNMGKPVARFEVDDYPPPDHNGHHGGHAPGNFEVDDYPPPDHNGHHGGHAPGGT